LAATFITVAIPYVVTVLLAEVELPARYRLTPDPGAIVMLAVPRFTMLIAVPTGQTTDVLLAIVRDKSEALVD
jgi:hypothetical protein